MSLMKFIWTLVTIVFQVVMSLERMKTFSRHHHVMMVKAV